MTSFYGRSKSGIRNPLGCKDSSGVITHLYPRFSPKQGHFPGGVRERRGDPPAHEMRIGRPLPPGMTLQEAPHD